MLVTRDAAAQSPSCAEAAELADSAYDLLNKKLYAEAVDLFDRADKRCHSPVFVLYMAQAREGQGKLVAARDLLERIHSERLPPDAPEAWSAAQVKARERMVDLDARIPLLTLRVRGAGRTPAKVTVDGREITPAELKQPIRLDPGDHRAVATNAKGARDERAVTLAERARRRLELVLAPVGSTRPPQPPPPDPEDSALGIKPSYLAAAIAYGVGGVGLIMGIAAGIPFIVKANDLKDACENDGDDPNTCPPERAEDIDDVKLLGNVSTAGWVIAGAGVVAGTILVLVPTGDEAEAGALRLHLAVGSVTVDGRF
jgi:hypothetical protein